MRGFAIGKSKKLTWKMVKEQPYIGIDLEPVDWDPAPELSRAIDIGGISGGLKHLCAKLGKSDKTCQLPFSIA